FGEDLAQGIALLLASGGCRDDRNVSGEFPEDLTAGPAGRSGFLGAGDHRDRPELPDTLGQGFPDGDPLGADREPVRRVLDTAPTPDPARLVVDRGADGEPAPPGDRVAAVLRRRLDQRVFLLDHASTAAAIFGTEAWRSFTNRAPTLFVVSSTS